jgi:Protease inhibitor Inh
MKSQLIAAVLVAVACVAGPALAQPAPVPDQVGPDDHEAGVPLTSAEAAGVWTLASGGRDQCHLTLGATHSVKADAGCREILPGPTGWQATRDGMALTDSGGKTILAFHRWSNSLFVSHRASGVDVQLRRGGPVAGGGH